MSVRILSLLCAISIIASNGCSKSDPVSSAGTTPAQAAATPPTDPAAIIAQDFVSAVVKGDTARATELLTPQAIAQFAASGQRFAAPGLDSAEFRIGQVRKVSDSQAVVQCMLSDKSPESVAAGVTEQEMLCLMRLVEGQWRVSGIAVDGEAGQPVILNFEQSEPSQSQPPANQQQFATQPGATTTPEIRTAQEPAPPQQR